MKLLAENIDFFFINSMNLGLSGGQDSFFFLIRPIYTQQSQPTLSCSLGTVICI